ncbi:DEAD/DEAH box helicase [Ureaplasma ceti]|uniref:Helicase/UvrB N-terminal domain-containing protein n=1 Tax=Ureaplasma ceti TaxID=3119530 RepID=A0ABP9U685_9BACT
MSYILKPCQQEACDALFDKISYYSNEQEYTFQAPTGAGKTLILCDLCERLLKDFNHKTLILFSSISTGEIYKQNYEKAQKYKYVNGYNYETHLIESPSNDKKSKNNDFMYDIPLMENCIYFIGTQSYTSSSILYNNGFLEQFLKDAKNQGYRIIFIRDEAHIGGTISRNDKTGSQNLLNLHNYFTKQLLVSATLSNKKVIDVQISPQAAEADGLIKARLIKGQGLNEVDEEGLTSEQLLEIALQQFETIKQKYPQTIRPALLIQVGNKQTNNIDYEDTIALVLQKIKAHNLNYVWYSSETGLDTNLDKLLKDSDGLYGSNKDLIVNNDSIIDVIMFKVSVATGYDIPRSCMLVQLREIYSENLNIQTIGRIRRNPNPDLKFHGENDITNNYYVYSNYRGNGKTKIREPLKLFPDFQNAQYNVLRYKTEFIDNYNSQTQINLEFAKQIQNQLLLFKESFLEYCAHFKTEKGYKIAVNEIETNNSTKTVYKEVINLFDVQRRFQQYLQNKTNFYKDNLKNQMKLFCQKYHLNLYVLQLYLISNLDSANQLRQSLEKSYDEKVTEETQYLFETVMLAKEVNQFHNDHLVFEGNEPIRELLLDPKDIDKKTYKYKPKGWDTLVSKTNYKAKYFFDSNPEICFANSVLKMFNSDNAKIFFGPYRPLPKFSVTKNYDDSSLVKFEYFKHVSGIATKAHSYPDFIVDIDDKTFFIEVKSLKNDYDSNKTHDLDVGYQNISLKYKTALQEDSWKPWTQNVNSVLEHTHYYFGIAWVDNTFKDDPKFTWTIYHDGEIFSSGENVSKSNIFKMFILK